MTGQISRDPSFLGNALESIKHRGQDASNIHLHPMVDICYVRLAITDKESNEIRHLLSNWSVYLNGEIYNYKDFGIDGNEQQVVSMLFRQYGPAAITQLNGMFFIVAINHSTDEVYVFRDRYGIKPVYYFETADEIIVASEIKAIIKHPDYYFDFNESAKKQWGVFNNVFTNETLFDGIFKMDKGTLWNLTTGITNKYWKWEFAPNPTMDYAFAKAEVKRLVKQAIARQIPAEVKYGSCLSGGLDSNIIVSQLGDIPTFTIGYAGHDDECQMAELQSRDHYTRVYNKVRDLNKTIYHLEDLRVGPSWQNYGLYELASKYVKVLFDGAGGDELFGGYPWRYSAKWYYQDVCNRTHKKDEHCEHIFNNVFPYDTVASRYEFDANHFLEGVLLVVDKLSMAHTIEVRVPFLDNDLVDFCLTLPNEFKQNKSILVDAFADELPEGILKGSKKGFSTPDWYEGDGNIAAKWADIAFSEWFNIFAK